MAPPDLLQKHWVHSHEEDTGDQQVFRPSGYPLGPSRGRRSFELKANGHYVDHGIGPTDRRVTSEGTWHLDPENRLALSAKGRGAPTETWEIVQVVDDRLVMRRR
jgi:hypothetical protein